MENEKNLLLQKRLASISVSRLKHSENGTNVVSLKQSEPISMKNKGIEDTMLPHLKTPLKIYQCSNPMLQSMNTSQITTIKKGSVIAESVVSTKKMICKDKLMPCISNTLHTKSLKISGQELILKEQASSNSAKKLLAGLSKKLWLPTKIGSVDSDLSMYNGYAINMTSNSWFKTRIITKHPNKKSQKISSQLFTFSPVVLMENESMRKKPARKKKSKIIKLDEDKIPCKFIVSRLINNIKYGRTCGDLVLKDKNYCSKHCNEEQPSFDKHALYLCKHIISQKSRNKDRKGMICNDFVTENNNYCTHHINQHNEEINGTKTLRSFKVRIYPTNAQKLKLEKYFGSARYTYNKCVEDKINKIKFDELRNKYVTKLPLTYKFLKDCPKEIRAFSAKEYLTGLNNSNDAYKSKLNREHYLREKYPKRKNKNIQKPEMNFRKKKNQQSITINKNSIKCNGESIIIYPDHFGKEPLKLKKKCIKNDNKLIKLLKSPIYHDIKIIKTPTKKYYLCFSEDVPVKDNVLLNQTLINSTNVCSIDPGIRTFMTSYNENKIEEIGTNAGEMMIKMIKKLDNDKKEYIKSIKQHQINKTEKTLKEKNRLKNLHKLAQEKIKNRVNDIHNKAITKLIEYDLILIPKLNLKRSLISKIVKRASIALRHCKFADKVAEKAYLNGKVVRFVKEHLTTKQCSNCLAINEVGSSKDYNCKKCNLFCDRDHNASKNILLNHLTNIK